MNISRRTFIRNNSLALAGASFLPSLANGKEKKNILGIQLYSVRSDMAKNPAGTLEKLAKMGYKYVEHAGYENGKFYGYSIPDFKKILSDNGLIMESGHSFLGASQWNKSAHDFTDEWKKTIADSKAVGMKYLISPGVDESLCTNMNDFRHYMDMFNKTGQLCKNTGLHFAYHNENYEFNHSLDGTVLYDLLLQSSDKNLVWQQIDTGNMYEPGGRAMDYLKKYPGRFFSMHVKDEMKKEPPPQKGNEYESCPLGKGVIPVKQIVDYARKSGIKYFIVEQEDYPDLNPMDAAAYDLKIMKGWGF